MLPEMPSTRATTSSASTTPTPANTAQAADTSPGLLVAGANKSSAMATGTWQTVAARPRPTPHNTAKKTDNPKKIHKCPGR